MTLLTRYLGREIYLSIGLVFLALIMLFSFLDLIHELNAMGQGQYHLGYVLLFVMSDDSRAISMSCFRLRS